MAAALPLAIPWLRRPGEVAARDFLALEAATQQLEAQRSESLDGLRCQQAAAEARRSLSVTLLERRLHRQSSDLRTSAERNQSIRQHINLYREEARAQVLPAEAMLRGGQSEAFDRLHESKQSFVAQAERLKSQWHRVMEEQMLEEIKAARSDAAHCQARQDEILSAAVRQEALLQDLCQERLRAQDERAKLYALDAEVQERHRTCRERLLLEMRRSGLQAKPERPPSADSNPEPTRDEPARAAAAPARSPQTQMAGVASTTVAAVPGLVHQPSLPDQAIRGPTSIAGSTPFTTAASSLHPMLRDPQPRGTYVPAQGTRQFEVYRRLTACELEMQSDLRLLEAGATAPPLPSSLRLGGRPATAPSVPPAAFQPQVGPPLLVAQLPPIPPPPRQPDLESHLGLERKMQRPDASADEGAAAWQLEARPQPPAPAAAPAGPEEALGPAPGPRMAGMEAAVAVHQPGASAGPPELQLVERGEEEQEEGSAGWAGAAWPGEEVADAGAPRLQWSEQHGEVEVAPTRAMGGTHGHMEELRSSSLSAVDEASTQSRMEDLLAWARAQPRQPAVGPGACAAAGGGPEAECDREEVEEEEEQLASSLVSSDLGSLAGGVAAVPGPAGAAPSEVAPADAGAGAGAGAAEGEEVARTTAGQIGLSARSSQARAATREAVLARKAFSRPKAPGSRAASERAALEQLTAAAALEAEGSDSNASWNLHSTSSRGASPRASAERASEDFGDLGRSFSFAGTPKGVARAQQHHLLEEQDEEEEVAVRPTASLGRPGRLGPGAVDAPPAGPATALVEQPILPKASTISAFVAGPPTAAMPGPPAAAAAAAAGRLASGARTAALPAATPEEELVSSGHPGVQAPTEVPEPPEVPFHMTATVSGGGSRPQAAGLRPEAAPSSVANLAAELGSFVTFGRKASPEAEQPPPGTAYRPGDPDRPAAVASNLRNAEPTPELPPGTESRRAEEVPLQGPIGGLAAFAPASAPERPLQAPGPWAAAASSAAAIAAAAAEQPGPLRRNDPGGPYEPAPAAAPKADDPAPTGAGTDDPPPRAGLSPPSTRQPSKTTAADLGFSDSDGEEPPAVPALARRVSGAFGGGMSGPPSARPEPPASASSHAALAAELGLSSGSEDLRGGPANQSGLSAKAAGGILAELGMDSDDEDGAGASGEAPASGSHYVGLRPGAGAGGRPAPKRGNPLARRANSGLSSLLADQQEDMLLPGAGRPKARSAAPLSSLASTLRPTAGKAKAGARPGLGGGGASSVLGGQIDWSQAEVQY